MLYKNFLDDYYAELMELKNDTIFSDIIRSILGTVDHKVIFPENKEHSEYIDFKRNDLYKVYVDENLYDRFAAYRYIYDSIKKQGNTGLSATISIFYGVVYLMTDDRHQNDVATNTKSDLDFRQKWKSPYRCDDGHYVRSKNEQLVDNWLYNHQICHAHEVLVVDKKKNVEY